MDFESQEDYDASGENEALYMQSQKEEHRLRQRQALRKVWKDTFVLDVDDVFLDLIIDTVEGA